MPTGHPGSTPKGPPTVVDPDLGTENKRSLSRENSVAALLSDKGYLVQQNPTKSEIAQARTNSGDHGSPIKDPDYLIEGRVFDCYSPNPDTRVRNVWSYVKAKIKDEQTQRVIVDLKDWHGNLPEVQKQFADWPIANLKEVKIITADDEVVQIIPDPNVY